MNNPDLIITQGPYSSFLDEVIEIEEVSGIRLNTIMPIKKGRIIEKLDELKQRINPKNLWIDLKARQLRIKEFANTPYTAVTISHKIKVNLPTTVYFDNGNITGKLVDIDGNRLILENYVGRLLGPGESVNILDPSLIYLEPSLFTETDTLFIEKCTSLGIHHFMLSFVEKVSDINALKNLCPDAVVMAKIESKKGLQNLEQITSHSDVVCAARGDLYVELDYPHEIGEALKYIKKISGDRGIVASRMFSSLFNHPVPSCPDVMDILYLKEIGYTHFLIGDDLCFDRDLLMKGINIFRAIFCE